MRGRECEAVRRFVRINLVFPGRGSVKLFNVVDAECEAIKRTVRRCFID